MVVEVGKISPYADDVVVFIKSQRDVSIMEDTTSAAANQRSQHWSQWWSWPGQTWRMPTNGGEINKADPTSTGPLETTEWKRVCSFEDVLQCF